MLFSLDKHDLWFPDPSLADDDGLLAIGGDLRTERLKLAYANGIFPWYSDDTPILWFAPKERFVLFPTEVHISRSMRKFMRSSSFTITENQAFAEVIRNCAIQPRKGQRGTWITQDMQGAYLALHKRGIASSIEVWADGQLCGGLYGVICGNKKHVFCGESMFSVSPNASKLALIHLCHKHSFKLIDCQIASEHLQSMGARLISSENYLKLLHT
ncbi:leucyl/phenylalanyl-tRNA--protein transferase [Olivibacter ginsenosidimutans]|uniref:Leucyl/phenylalanyl-tRNA--protein transferase n=1 Tax=Olivibacter ginsenosidimutans TaxID=1176537 RepID=A0ABP9C6E8_9SPHI